MTLPKDLDDALNKVDHCNAVLVGFALRWDDPDFEQAETETAYSLAKREFDASMQELRALMGQQLKELAQQIDYSHENSCNAWNNYPHDCGCVYREENEKLSRLKGDDAL